MYEARVNGQLPRIACRLIPCALFTKRCTLFAYIHAELSRLQRRRRRRRLTTNRHGLETMGRQPSVVVIERWPTPCALSATALSLQPAKLPPPATAPTTTTTAIRNWWQQHRRRRRLWLWPACNATAEVHVEAPKRQFPVAAVARLPIEGRR